MADRQYRYAQIIIDISHEKLDRPFTYRIPDGLADQVEPGSRVRVPFGHTVRTGYVIELTDSCDLPENKIRQIGEVLLPGQGYSREKDSGFYIRLAAWMKDRYGATTITALKTVLTSRKTGSPKVRRQIRLLLDRSAAEEKLAFYHRKHQVARERLLRELIGTPVQPYDLITTRLHVGAPVIRAMKQAGVIEVESHTDLRNPVSVSPDAGERKTLSPAQQRISDEVVESFEAGRPGVTLIRGITGSGKTEVYISIISRICRSGRQAIMLIPEIALTYQTLLRFYRHFGDRVSVINSSLSESEKADQWERARRGEIDVIIGPRSALFTPFERLGVIVIDEEHENSYKNESMPKYHARETAIQIARMRGACVVLGSATPSMESYYRALRGEYRLFTLDERLTGGNLPCTEIADMRMELRRGNRSILSRSLDSLIRDRLARGEQTMLFLNR
ncbi:MAG: primosomal protein N', partial [Lachnospiraceae bacterium]|nr:primosomal protein N' [Lachnospiraceae bacterium]